MLHNAPLLLVPVAKLEIPKRCRSGANPKTTPEEHDPRRVVPVGLFGFIPQPVSDSSIQIKAFSFSGPTFVTSKRLTTVLPSQLRARETFGALPGSPTDDRGNRS
jgi:hypothetical protein